MTAWPNRRLLLLVCLALAVPAFTQTCVTADDMNEGTRSALTSTAQHYFDLMAHGDSAGLKQNSVASLASSFDSVDGLVKNSQAKLSQANANPRPPFLLKVEPTREQTPGDRAEFLCGVFGAHGQTANSAEFVLSGLTPGSYAVVILDADASVITFALQQQGADWKLAGLYLKDSRAAGHDAVWFEQKANTFKSKSQTRNAWLYLLEARDLASPVPFMSTQLTDRLYDEAQPVKPTDLPGDSVVDLPAGTKTYKLIVLYPVGVGDELDLVVKYQSADVSNSVLVFQDNAAVMKALIAKFPEFRDAFDGVVARATEPSGKDYGSLMSMKDIK